MQEVLLLLRMHAWPWPWERVNEPNLLLACLSSMQKNFAPDSKLYLFAQKMLPDIYTMPPPRDKPTRMIAYP